MKPVALVIGDVITDIMVMPSGPIIRGTDTRATIRHMPGGAGANQASWLARSGVDVRFVAKVGASDTERLARHFLSLGVTPCLSPDETAPTGQLVCIVESDAERSFLTDRGANANLCEADLPLSLLERVSVVHLSAYALFEPGPREAVLRFLEHARDRDITVSIDPASTGFLREIGARAFLGWTRGADIVFPNAQEAEFLTGLSDPGEQVDTLLEHFPTVVLKRGDQGAILGRREAERVSRPAVSVLAQDSTGAGDAFLAAFLAARLVGESPEVALDHAVAAGAKAVTRVGASPD